MLRGFCSVFLVWVLLVPVGQGQRSQSEFMGVDSPETTTHIVMPSARNAAAMQIEARNNARRSKLLSDTNKLLALASSFEQEAAKGETLSPKEAAHRAAEIEKLARSVKDGMRY
jgi:ATP-dependent helicase/DNAse subunit B